MDGIGALVVSQRFYKSLPTDLQKLLKESGAKVGEEINIISRRDNRKSIELLKQSGIQFLWSWSDKEKDQMLLIRDEAAKALAESEYIPEAQFSRTKAILQEFRKQKN